MTKRVILGERTSNHGLWISKPGFDVEFASDDQLLFTTASGFDSFQVIATGRVQLLNDAPVNIITPDVGFKPAAYIVPEVDWGAISSNRRLQLWTTYDSNTSVWLHISHNNISYSGYSAYAIVKVAAIGV